MPHLCSSCHPHLDALPPALSLSKCYHPSRPGQGPRPHVALPGSSMHTVLLLLLPLSLVCIVPPAGRDCPWGPDRVPAAQSLGWHSYMRDSFAWGWGLELPEGQTRESAPFLLPPTLVPQCVGGQSPWLSSEHLGSRPGEVPRAGAWSQRLSGGGGLVRTVGVCQGLAQVVLAPRRGQKASPHMSFRAPALL